MDYRLNSMFRQLHDVSLRVRSFCERHHTFTLIPTLDDEEGYFAPPAAEFSYHTRVGLTGSDDECIQMDVFENGKPVHPGYYVRDSDNYPDDFIEVDEGELLLPHRSATEVMEIPNLEFSDPLAHNHELKNPYLQCSCDATSSEVSAHLSEGEDSPLFLGDNKTTTLSAQIDRDPEMEVLSGEPHASFWTLSFHTISHFASVDRTCERLLLAAAGIIDYTGVDLVYERLRVGVSLFHRELHGRVATLMLAHGISSDRVAIARHWFSHLGMPRKIAFGALFLVVMQLTTGGLLWLVAGLIKGAVSITLSHGAIIGIVAMVIFISSSAQSNYLVYKTLAAPVQDYRSYNLREVGDKITDILRPSVDPFAPGVSPSHRFSCVERDRFIEMVPVICEIFHREPYFVGLSRRNGELFGGLSKFKVPEYEHLNAPEHADRENDYCYEDKLLIFCDTDYYLDMNDILLLGLPCLVYTFYPKTAGSTGEEYSYHFDNGDYVVGKISGGKNYRHQIWDYGDDQFKVSKWGYYQSYKVYNHELPCEHLLRLLLPNGCGYTQNTHALKRKQYVHNDCAIVVSRDSDGTELTYLGVVRISAHVYVEHEIWHAVLAHFQARSIKRGEEAAIKVDIGIAIKPLFAPMFDTPEALSRFIAEKADELYPYLVAYSGSHESVGFTGVGEYARRYTYLSKNKKKQKTNDWELSKSANYQFDDGCSILSAEDEGRVGKLDVVQPFTHPAACPVLDSDVNLRDMTEKRINKPQQQASDATDKFDSDLIPVMKGFLNKVFGDIKLTPIDDEEVAKRMKTPSQVSHREAYEYEDLQRQATIFVKDETYGETKPVRAITTNNGKTKWELARYIYAIMDFLKTKNELPGVNGCKWFMPGKSPRTVAYLVARVCQMAKQKGIDLSKTDFSKFDGTVGAILRFLVVLMFHLVFPGDSKVQNLNADTYSGEATIGVGEFSEFLKLFIHPGFALGSGNQITSLLGCLGNAFIAFAYFVVCEGMSFDEAYDALGVFLGDDGLSAVKDLKGYVEFAKRMGHTLEAEACGLNKPVQFLSRYYSPEVFDGCTDSCCDIKRQLQKIHIIDKSYETRPLYHHWLRTQGYLVTDANTPFIGEYCRAVARLCEPLNYKLPFNPNDPNLNEEMVYGALAQRTDYLSYLATQAFAWHTTIPNEDHGGWMWKILEDTLRDFDGEAASTWARTLQPPPFTKSLNSKGVRSAYEKCVLKMLRDRGDFGDTDVLVTPSDDKIVVLNTGDDIIAVPPNGRLVQAPPPSKIPVADPRQVIGLEALNALVTNNPWNLTPGAMKCLIFIAKFSYTLQARKKYKDAKRIIFYTGSAGKTDQIAAHAFSHAYCRVEFFDTMYLRGSEKSRVASLKELVAVRATRVNPGILRESLNGANDVWWLDDMFSEQDKNARKTYNDLKCTILQEVKPKFAIIKIMLDCHSIYPVGSGVTYFKYPCCAPFHVVRELRCVVDSLQGDVSFVQGDTNEIEFCEMPAWEAALMLADFKTWLDENPPRLRPAKPVKPAKEPLKPRKKGKGVDPKPKPSAP